jgi:dienelactone hydrolase
MFKSLLRIFGVFLMVILSGSFINAEDFKQTSDYQIQGVQGNLPVFYQQIKDKLTFPLSWNSGKIKDFSEWKKTAKNKVLELLLQNTDKTPFNPQIIDEQDRGTYLARKVVFNVTAESRVLALILVPKGKGPFPAVLLLHDHGSKFDIGKEKFIEPWGNDEKLKSAKKWADKYFSGVFIGNELASRGYAVMAVDALGWGDRIGGGYEAQQALESNLMNLGSSLAGLMAIEDLRSADFLTSMKEVDSSNVASLGFSMGSFRSWQVAALSDKIKACIAVCWMGTTKGLMVPDNNILRGQSSFYTTHPGLINYLDYPDVASIAAPKPMLFYNGEEDLLFPKDSVKDAYDKMKQVWDSQKSSDKLETRFWPFGHVFVKEEQDAAFKWLDKWMKSGK